MRKPHCTLFLLLLITAYSCHKNRQPLGPVILRDNHIGIAIIPQSDIPWPSLANTGWPMHHHDPQFTGRSKWPGPQQGKIKWRYAANAPVGTSSVAADSFLYFATSYDYAANEGQISRLIALSYSGALHWQTAISSTPLGCAPLVSKDGAIYFAALDGRLYALATDGRQKWTFTANHPIDLAGMNISLDGTLFFVDKGHVLYAVKDGSLRWTLSDAYAFQSGSSCSIALSPDGATLYLGLQKKSGQDSSSGLAAVTNNGQVKWVYDTGNVECTPLVDNDGNIFFQAGLGKGKEETKTGIYSLTRDGILRWQISAAYANVNAMAMNYNGFLCFPWEKSGTESYIAAADQTGQVLWQYDISHLGQITSGLVCDANGYIYGVANNTLLCLTPDGALKWQVETGPAGFVSPALDNGLLFVGTWFPKNGAGLGKEFICVE